MKTYNNFLNENRINLLKYLEEGGNPNGELYPGFHYLHQAALNDSSKNIQLLIDAGADINILTFEGKTALMYAVGACRYNAVKLLIELGADVNIISNNNYMNALNLAAYNCKIEIIELFMNTDADWDIKTNTGDFFDSFQHQNKRDKFEKMLDEKYPGKYRDFKKNKQAKKFKI